MTARHLLTHTSGIGEVLAPTDVLRPLFGETVKAGRAVPTLAEHYGAGLRVRVDPGTRWRYTDHGFAALGQLVEDVTGQPLPRYLREHVFEPLGMADTALTRTARVSSRLATGYTLGRRGTRPVPDYEVLTGGASCAYSTPRDMARYLAALLGGGANEHGRVLEPASVNSMFAAQYQPDPRIPGMGLAFFRGNAGGHSTVEHGGVLPGYDSQLFAAPEDQVAVMAFTNGARQAMMWLPDETSRLLNHQLGIPDEALATDIPAHPEIWPDLCGRYLLPGPLTDVRARSMAGAGCRGPGPARPPDPARPDPDPRGLPRIPAAPRRPHRPLHVPDRPLPIRDRHRPRHLQPDTRKKNHGHPLRPRTAPLRAEGDTLTSFCVPVTASPECGGDTGHLLEPGVP